MASTAFTVEQRRFLWTTFCNFWGSCIPYPRLSHYSIPESGWMIRTVIQQTDIISRRMCRVAVWWNSQVFCISGFLKNPQNFLQPVAKMYLLWSNSDKLPYCSYGSQTSYRFGLQPPILQASLQWFRKESCTIRSTFAEKCGETAERRARDRVDPCSKFALANWSSLLGKEMNRYC